MARQIVLITGCSDGGLGSALALSLHKAGHRVIATARNLSKLGETRKAGIEEIELDVLSQDSISAAAQKLEALTGGRLDILVNNAGLGFNTPVIDLDLAEVKKIFDVNVFSLIPVSRAFLPALMKSNNAKIVNNISVAAFVGLPFQGTYNSSKAAANSLTETLRLELQPFGIRVIALFPGTIKTNFFNNIKGAGAAETAVPLPDDSIYRVVPGGLQMLTNPEPLLSANGEMASDVWADIVGKEIVKLKPAFQIWTGPGAFQVRLGLHLPVGYMDKTLGQITKLDEVEKALGTRE